MRPSVAGPAHAGPATGAVFLDTYQGEIDVSTLTGFELGCNLPTTNNVPTSVLRTWDAITTVSETYKGVGGRYIDTITNVGCRNPTKISGGRTSLFPILEVALGRCRQLAA